MNLLEYGAKQMSTPSAADSYCADSNLPLTVMHLQHGDAEFDVGGDDLAWLVLVLSESQVVERKSHGVWSHRPSRIGAVTVIDPDELTRFSIRGQANVARLRIPVSALAKAAGLNRRPNVRARFMEREPNLERFAQRALVALHKDAGADPLFSSSIVMGLSKTMIEQLPTVSNHAIGGLSRRHLRRVNELIDSRLSAPVSSSPSLSELAAEASLSLHHFAREFRRTTGVTPHAYMLRRRLERARRSIINSTLPLARIGILSGFPSAAHFANRFHREMGVTPSALRRAAQT